MHSIASIGPANLKFEGLFCPFSQLEENQLEEINYSLDSAAWQCLSCFQLLYTVTTIITSVT